MNTVIRKSLDEYLALQYSFHVVADPDGGYVVLFPDLPGCLTQVETLDELAATAQDARVSWIESEYEMGHDIPLPSYPEEYSGRFNVRLPKSLHRTIAEAAARDGVSLNQYIVFLLGRGDAQVRLERKLADFEMRLAEVQAHLQHGITSLPATS